VVPKSISDDRRDPPVECPRRIVRAAESLVRQLEACSSGLSRPVVVLGLAHTPYFLDRRAAPF
jgi:hypothetical protein